MEPPADRQQIVAQALQLGHQVRAVACDTSAIQPAGNLEIVHGDVTDLSSVASTLQGHDLVLCALGPGHRSPTMLYSTAARNLAQAMLSVHLSRIVLVSNFHVFGELKGLFGFLLGMRLKDAAARSPHGERRGLTGPLLGQRC